MSLMILICAVFQTGLVTSEVNAQCDCLNTFEFDPDLEFPCLPDTGAPSEEFLLIGGDIAGNKVPLIGTPLPDGLINELDLIRLIDLAYRGVYENCADVDRNGVLTLVPITINGIEYPGDLRVLSAAVYQDLICQPVCASIEEEDPDYPCNKPHSGAGCNDPICCSLTCELEPFCCDVQWDAFCAETASEIACADYAGDCLLVNGTPSCLNNDCANAVCLFDPQGDGSFPFEDCCEMEWDVTCVEIAGEVCLQIFCDQEENLFGCPYDNCGDPLSGRCDVQNGTPGCRDGACCALVCLVDPFCCNNAWDQGCAQAAAETCPLYDPCDTDIKDPDDFELCGFPNAADCFSAHPGAACGNFACCSTVCEIDAFCCSVRWDTTCSLYADQFCTISPGCGDPFNATCFQDSTPEGFPYATQFGCNNTNCCNIVCELQEGIDLGCCSDEVDAAGNLIQGWTQGCADLAELYCTGCGDLTAGSCYNENNTSPSCNNEECCETVCMMFDPFCCDEIWDSLCSDYAVRACGLPSDICGETDGNTRNCLVPGITRGCADPACCQIICDEFDTYCCEVNWDAICVTTALNLTECNAPGVTPDTGNCLTANGTPGCNVPACASAICSIDPLCCTENWSEACAVLALDICYDLAVCPGEGKCTLANGSPGCEDPYCCNIVCTIDPLCCDLSWSQVCATLGSQLCDGSTNPVCPCSGDCFSNHDNPGCEIESCCQAVCVFDADLDGEPDYADCCEIEWDATCVGIANTICKRGNGCGDFSAGSCLRPKDTPNCADPACCAAVCQIDPFCCSNRWDGTCALLAEERCRSGCGVPTAGSCFVAKVSPGCSEGPCCAEICEIDPFCCQSSWDSNCSAMALTECDAPECGDYETGSCCIANETPNCNDAACCESVCNQDPFCCDEGAWDDLCVFLARQSPQCPNCEFECGDPCAGDCCSPNGTPGCNDTACCDAVCLLDIFCCSNEWDIYCATQAQSTCNYNGENGDEFNGSIRDACPAPKCGDPGTGTCCFANGTPGCDNEACCNTIGAIDPYCSNQLWDSVCADLARENPSCDCEPASTCGDPAAGDCCDVSKTAYCSDQDCCNTICLIDPLCCSIAWDSDCVVFAELYCLECTPPGLAPPKGWISVPVDFYPASKASPKKIAKMKKNAKSGIASGKTPKKPMSKFKP